MSVPRQFSGSGQLCVNTLEALIPLGILGMGFGLVSINAAQIANCNNFNKNRISGGVGGARLITITAGPNSMIVIATDLVTISTTQSINNVEMEMKASMLCGKEEEAMHGEEYISCDPFQLALSTYWQICLSAPKTRQGKELGKRAARGARAVEEMYELLSKVEGSPGLRKCGFKNAVKNGHGWAALIRTHQTSWHGGTY
ncbi:hypothetical protein B0H34DRAFT_679882 [Crassisporium funariophilum]|nr:hypothetical protein B0H34DRAFT_679882 [Crassisporium funariophilum]